MPCIMGHNSIFSFACLKSKVVQRRAIGLRDTLVEVVTKKVGFGFKFQWR
jgi:hypothetical protein